MANAIETLATQRLSEFQAALTAEEAKTPASSARAAQDAQIVSAVKAALADDGQIGPNDAPWLSKMVKGKGLHRLDVLPLIAALRAKYVAPPIKQVAADSPYAVAAVFQPRKGAFSDHLNSAQNPRLDLVRGAPEGLGADMQSLDVVPLGRHGKITLTLGKPATHGLIVFGNPFYKLGTTTLAENKPAKVQVSSDGKHWKTLGKAGFVPVYANSKNQIDPLSLAAGGDRFSFAAAGIDGAEIKYVRITDLSKGKSGDGFALDAVRGY